MAAVDADLPARGAVRWVITGVAVLVLLADIVANLVFPESRGTIPQQLLVGYLAFALAMFGWHPRVAAVAVLFGFPLGMWADDISPVIFFATACTGAVAATTARRVLIGYAASYVAIMVVVGVLPDSGWDAVDVFMMLLLAAASFAVGFVVRRVRWNEQALAARVARMEAMLEAAKREERERIGDELHDLIIRDLTIIAMHAKVLERSRNPEQLASSREVIASSSRHALGDLRRVLRLTRTEGSGDWLDGGVELLAPALQAVGSQLGALGIELELDVSESAVEALDPTTSASFARALREAAANVIKHASGSPRVMVRLTDEGRNVVLDVNNAPAPGRAPRRVPVEEDGDLPAGGYGLARMTERFGVLGGGVTAGPDSSGGWRVRAHLPR
ncbi:sensor histidine kinase [Salana multivorans]